METFRNLRISYRVIGGILLCAGARAQLTIPQQTMVDVMRNADIMNRAMKNAEERAKAAPSSGGTGVFNGIGGRQGPATDSAVPLAMLPFGHIGIRYPSNCRVAAPDERFQFPMLKEHESPWWAILCADGTWLQGWTKMLKATTDPVSIDSLADEELSYFKNGTFQTGSSMLGPLSTSRTFSGDPRGQCHGIVGVENDWSYYTFVLCYPNTPQALWTKEQLRLGFTRLERQSPRFSIPIGQDCTFLQQETLDSAYFCTDGTFVDVSTRMLLSTGYWSSLEEFASQKSTMEFADDQLAEREPYRTVMNPIGPFSIERFHKVSDDEERICADIVTQEDAGWYYIIRYCYNKTARGIRAMEMMRAGIQRGGVSPGVEFYKIE